MSLNAKSDYRTMAEDSYFESWGQPVQREVNGYFAANPGSNFLPTADHSFDDGSLRNDWRGLGLGTQRAFKKPDERISDEFKNMESPLYRNTIPNTNRKSAGINRNLEMEYAMRKINNSRHAERPMGTNINPREKHGVNVHNNLNAHFHNLRGHLHDNSQDFKRQYRPPASRLTKMITMDLEKNSLRPTRSSAHPMKLYENDPRQYIQYRAPRNADVREMVTAEKGIAPYGSHSKMNGVSAYTPYQRVDHFREPIANHETGQKDIYSHWGMPKVINSGRALARENENKLLRQYAHNKEIRGFDLEQELAAHNINQNRVRNHQRPDPYGVGTFD